MIKMSEILLDKDIKRPKYKNLIGHGYTSLVYYVEGMHVEVFTISQEKVEYMRRLNYSVNKIGSIKIGKIEYPVYRFEMEYLEPLTKEQKSTINRFNRVLKSNGKYAHLAFPFLEELFNDNLLPDWLENVLDLAWDESFDKVLLDYKTNQFRQKDGKIFMVDPMVNVEQLQNINKTLRAKYLAKYPY